MNNRRGSVWLTAVATTLAASLAMSTSSVAQQREVRWNQWKGTEVGEKFMSELKAAFEKDHPDITLVSVDAPFTGFHDRAIVQHQANKLADVLMVQVDWVAEFADLGMIEPLDDLIAKEPPEFFGNIPSAFHQKWRGKQYYLPVESGSVALFYNTDLFAAAGLSDPPKTWDEFAEMARKLTDPEKRQFAVTATLQSEPPTNMTYDIYPLILQAGGTLIDAETNKAAFNSPEGVAAIEWYVERVNKDKISVPGVLSNGEKEKRANFASGNIAMMFEGPWGIAIQRQLNPNLNYKIAPLPEGKTTGTMVRGSLNTLTAQAKDKEAAWTFLKWLSGPRGMAIWSKGTGALPARTDVMNEEWFKEKTEFAAFVSQMERPTAQSPFLVMPNAVQMNKIMTTEVQNVVQGKKSAKEALDDAAAEWNKIFAATK
ncbi:ABC-type glycerol-3-phosphate transport system substrate-binding protein [Chelatococcus caeni]|uniref:ABC-type glycerol-3-phosphate transport system substrate-binding protein n=1 Tax=Chelatococcus caeni TaxID=1348468 RepID=A0A840C2A2_9HYPH|nr:ABC transporter substrate-binding protein [Chelatococcus caeni]MBB4018943.1 ABC-type glycerol-3-phosphate transport system substrate-binding protein [Chelatococcus caeni]